MFGGMSFQLTGGDGVTPMSIGMDNVFCIGSTVVCAAELLLTLFGGDVGSASGGGVLPFATDDGVSAMITGGVDFDADGGGVVMGSFTTPPPAPFVVGEIGSVIVTCVATVLVELVRAGGGGGCGWCCESAGVNDRCVPFIDGMATEVSVNGGSES